MIHEKFFITALFFYGRTQTIELINGIQFIFRLKMINMNFFNNKINISTFMLRIFSQNTRDQCYFLVNVKIFIKVIWKDFNLVLPEQQ